MDKIYRFLLIAVLAVGILFGLQYFLPITAQYFNVKGVSGIPGLPSMPTVAYQSTTAPLPLITLESPAFTQVASFVTAQSIPGASATSSSTPLPGASATPTPSASATVTQTLRPGATAVPRTDTLTPRPGAPTSTKTSTSPAPTATATIGQVASQPCNNVLYPVKTGQGWLYQINAQGRSVQAMMVVAAVSGQQGVVDVYNQATGGFAESLVTCDNGAILGFPSILGFLMFNDSSGSLNVQYVSGVLAPSEATFEKNNWNMSWSGQYRLTGQVTVPFQGQNFAVDLNNSLLTLACRTDGFEPVSVTAGNASRALRVVCTANSPVTLTVNGNNVSGTISGQSTQWFALHTGLLKMHVDSTSFNVIGITLPVNVNGSVELLKLQLAP